MSVPVLKLPFLSEDGIRSSSALAAEPDWLLGVRLDALAQVTALPAETNQLFTTYLDLRAARFDAIRLETPVAGHDADAQARDGRSADAAVPPAGMAALVEIRGGRVMRRLLGTEARRAAVTIDEFATVLRTRPELLRPHLEGNATLPAGDAFAQVARAASSLGVLIHLPTGARLQEPIVVRWLAPEPGQGAVTRTLIVLEDGAQARILEEQLPAEDTEVVLAPASAAAAQRLWWGTTEVVLGDGASLEVAALQDFGMDTLAFVNRHATLGADAHLRWALASVGAQLHKSRIDNILVGRGSSVHQAEIGFGSGSQLFDLTSYTRHIGEDTTGDLLSKGVFTDRSRGYIKGLIEIQRSARGTDSFLGEFGMLLTKKARSVTIPSLEIDPPNVRRASHSSSVGPIDEAQIFYLMSRGLDRETARKSIVLAFLEPVVARIPVIEAQDLLRGLLEAKWPRVSTESAPAAA